MSDNPVIYENKMFKFLSDDDEVQHCNTIIDRFTRHVKAAMLYASNDLIHTTMTLNKTQQLFEYYNARNSG